MRGSVGLSGYVLDLAEGRYFQVNLRTMLVQKPKH
jgi:hypothetical protein